MAPAKVIISLDREALLDPERHGEVGRSVAERIVHTDSLPAACESGPGVSGVLKDAAAWSGERTKPKFRFLGTQFPSGAGRSRHRRQPGDVAEPCREFRLTHLIVGSARLAI